MNRSGAVRKDHLVISLAIVVLVAVTVMMTLQTEAVAQDRPQDIPAKEQKVVKKDSGLEYIEVRLGVGETVKVGSKIKVFYAGKLKDGTPVDSNIGKMPYDITVGETRLIRGMAEGLLGIKEGGKRKLLIPPQLGYGKEGSPPKVPPKADLVFEVEVIKVTN
jgi:FKBP-type peptidyl-prolyl cis-trans isomerase